MGKCLCKDYPEMLVDQSIRARASLSFFVICFLQCTGNSCFCNFYFSFSCCLKDTGIVRTRDIRPHRSDRHGEPRRPSLPYLYHPSQFSVSHSQRFVGFFYYFLQNFLQLLIDFTLHQSCECFWGGEERKSCN